MDERRAVGQLAFVLPILLFLLNTPVVHAQEDSSEVAGRVPSRGVNFSPLRVG